MTKYLQLTSFAFLQYEHPVEKEIWQIMKYWMTDHSPVTNELHKRIIDRVLFDIYIPCSISILAAYDESMFFHLDNTWLQLVNCNHTNLAVFDQEKYYECKSDDEFCATYFKEHFPTLKLGNCPLINPIRYHNSISCMLAKYLFAVKEDKGFYRNFIVVVLFIYGLILKGTIKLLPESRAGDLFDAVNKIIGCLSIKLNDVSYLLTLPVIYSFVFANPEVEEQNKKLMKRFEENRF